MKRAKSARTLLISLLVATQLFAYVGPAVHAAEVNGEVTSEEVAIESLLDEKNIEQARLVLHSIEVEKEEQRQTYFYFFEEQIGMIEDGSFLVEELLFAISSLNTVWGDETAVLLNNYFPNSSEATNFAESLNNFTENLKTTEYFGLLSNAATIEEQAQIFEEYFGVEDLQVDLLNFANFYSETLSKVDEGNTEVVEEETPIDTEEDPIESDETEEPIDSVEESEVPESASEEEESEDVDKEETEIIEEKPATSIQAFSTKATDIDIITFEQDIEYMAEITGVHTLDTKPWGVKGFKTVDNSKKHIGKTVKILKEASTGRANWVQFNLSGTLVWMDAVGIKPETSYNHKTVNYEAKITRANDTINSLPWGVKGFVTNGKTNSYLNRTVTVIEEATSPRGNWVKVKLGDQILGWLDKKAIDTKGVEKILSSQTVKYAAQITQKGHTLDTSPWGTVGFKTVGKTDSVYGTTVNILEEATTVRGEWVKFNYLGQYVWMDKKGVTPEAMTNTVNTNYQATIKRTTDSIQSLPWGIKGYKVTGYSSDYKNQTVTVIQETSTPRANWALIQLNGKTLGWIDIKALDTKGFERILSSQTVDYQAKIIQNGHSLDTSPWGTVGFKTVAKSNQYYGQTFKVVEEATTVRANWAKIKVGSQYLWIDIKALKPESILSSTKKNYQAEVVRSTDTITTLPWGVKGFKTTGRTSSYIGQAVTVIAEAKTERATWAQIQLNGKTLGWVDIKALTKPVVKTIFIDPGHGGSDPGAHYFGVSEKTINLRVSLKLRDALVKKGYRVIMARTTDIALDFKTQRSAMANATDADIFISVHHNAYPLNSVINGIETYFYEYEPEYPSVINKDMHNNPTRIANSSKLAHAIHNQLISATNFRNRGVQSTSFAVLRETRIPAVLLELGYMSNRAELNKLVTDSHMNKEVQAIVNGIDQYFGK